MDVSAERSQNEYNSRVRSWRQRHAACYTNVFANFHGIRAASSAGRALRSQRRGREFEPPAVHHPSSVMPRCPMSSRRRARRRVPLCAQPPEIERPHLAFVGRVRVARFEAPANPHQCKHATHRRDQLVRRTSCGPAAFKCNRRPPLLWYQALYLAGSSRGLMLLSQRGIQEHHNCTHPQYYAGQQCRRATALALLVHEIEISGASSDSLRPLALSISPGLPMPMRVRCRRTSATCS